VRLTIISLLAISLFIGSCDKDDPEPIYSYPASRMTAKVNGQIFTSDALQANLTANNVALTGAVNAGTSKVSTITFSINNYAGLATYPIDSLTTASYSKVTGTFKAESGSITVTTYNSQHVVGTFSFVGTDSTETVSVTDGTFDYQRQ
jgi:hypothetical protein